MIERGPQAETHALPRLRRALEYLPAAYAFARGNARKFLAMALHSSSQGEEALRMLDRCLDLYQRCCQSGERLGEILEREGKERTSSLVEHLLND